MTRFRTVHPPTSTSRSNPARWPLADPVAAVVRVRRWPPTARRSCCRCPARGLRRWRSASAACQRRARSRFSKRSSMCAGGCSVRCAFRLGGRSGRAWATWARWPATASRLSRRLRRELSRGGGSDRRGGPVGRSLTARRAESFAGELLPAAALTEGGLLVRDDGALVRYLENPSRQPARPRKRRSRAAHGGTRTSPRATAGGAGRAVLIVRQGRLRQPPDSR
jgi:hypothetical protein